MPDFWDTFQSTAGLDWVGSEEKKALIEAATPLPVLKVFKAESQFGPRYVMVTNIDGNDRAMGFAAESVDSRDQMFEALMRYLEQEDAETPFVIIEQSGRSMILRKPGE